MKRNAPTDDDDGSGGSATDTAGAGCGQAVDGIKRAFSKLTTPAAKRTATPSAARGTPRRVISGPKTPSSSRSNNNQMAPTLKISDPVQVFCRVRPLDANTDSCLSVLDEQSLKIFPPESGQWNKGKEIVFSCERVFDETADQNSIFTVMAKPLVQDLLDGKNSLLFAYGVTGSGKTYTMTGTSEEPGILNRSADVLFNTIIKFKAQKNVFISDKMNGFDAQTKADAMTYRDKELRAQMQATPGPASRIRGATRSQQNGLNNLGSADRVRDTTVLSIRHPDYIFAVFVTYVEIYNNFVYDLLDENTKDGKLESKVLRDDASRNTMYVHNAKEIEVESPGELLEVFARGQKRRRTASTNLNDGSSRSHSVFNIRLVQAPLDAEGEEVLDDKNSIHISQLTLVDLAGSERYGRTGATGDRLKEAGRINSSLMTLRQCFEALRKSQQVNGEVFIPYKSTRLTSFLKGYFEGQGRVRMILCVNPKADDYDENIHVLSFAEMTKEIVVQRDTPALRPDPLTPGRRIANSLYKDARRRVVEEIPLAEEMLAPVDIDMVYSLGPPLPLCKITKPEEVQLITNLRIALEKRLKGQKQLQTVLLEKRTDVRNRISKLDQENESLKISNRTLASKVAGYNQERDNMQKLIQKMEFEKADLETKFENAETQILELLEQVERLKQDLADQEIGFNQERQRMEEDLGRQRELDEMKRERKLIVEERKLKAEYNKKDKTIAAVRQLMSQVDQVESSDFRTTRSRSAWKNETMSSSSSDPDLHTLIDRDMSPMLPYHSSTRTRSRVLSEPRLHNIDLLSPRGSNVSSEPRLPLDSLPAFKYTANLIGTPLANRRRSKPGSSKADKWVEHLDPNTINTGTVFQPKMNKKRSVSKLTKPEDIVANETSKYCLRTDVCDTDGEVETRLYKADVLPTVSGGAQVVFHDLEILKQVSPTSASAESPILRKRPSRSHMEYDPTEVKQKCTIGIGGGGSGNFDTVDDINTTGTKRSRRNE